MIWDILLGDRVYVNRNSLVGSIGVIGTWTGLSGWLKKYEIENRKFTSNEYVYE
jgi:ClpP class serine protease